MSTSGAWECSLCLLFLQEHARHAGRRGGSKAMAGSRTLKKMDMVSVNCYSVHDRRRCGGGMVLAVIAQRLGSAGKMWDMTGDVCLSDTAETPRENWKNCLTSAKAQLSATCFATGELRQRRLNAVPRTKHDNQLVSSGYFRWVGAWSGTTMGTVEFLCVRACR